MCVCVCVMGCFVASVERKKIVPLVSSCKMAAITHGTAKKKKKQTQDVKGTIYWKMDGNRRYEVVTSCDHLHGSHASYSDRTQMLRYNTGLYVDTDV